MKKSNEPDSMNPGDFEKQLERRPLRPVPAEWRAEILAAAKTAAAPQLVPAPKRSGGGSTLNSQLSAFLRPCPQAWAGLAAIWLVILAVNFSASDKKPMLAQAAPPPSRDTLRMVQEQRRMLAQLLEPRNPPPAEPPKPFIPRPRGEIQNVITFV
jgi:hypothetical protein